MIVQHHTKFNKCQKYKRILNPLFTYFNLVYNIYRQTFSLFKIMQVAWILFFFLDCNTAMVPCMSSTFTAVVINIWFSNLINQLSLWLYYYTVEIHATTTFTYVFFVILKLICIVNLGWKEWWWFRFCYWNDRPRV